MDEIGLGGVAAAHHHVKSGMEEEEEGYSVRGALCVPRRIPLPFRGLARPLTRSPAPAQLEIGDSDAYARMKSLQQQLEFISIQVRGWVAVGEGCRPTALPWAPGPRHRPSAPPTAPITRRRSTSRTRSRT